MGERVRSFVAFEIDPDAKERIGRYAASLRGLPGGKEWKWVRPEILHMTVRFFGELDRKQLAKARRAVGGLDRRWAAPQLSIGRLGAFPSLSRPRVLWLGIEDAAGRLAALAVAVDRAIRTVGFGPADKPFVAHLTLARLGRGRRAPEAGVLSGGLTPPEGPLTIRSVTLFRSDLRPEGPRYTPLEIAQPRWEPDGPVGPDPERWAERSSLPPRARRTGQDPEETKEGDPSNG